MASWENRRRDIVYMLSPICFRQVAAVSGFAVTAGGRCRLPGEERHGACRFSLQALWGRVVPVRLVAGRQVAEPGDRPLRVINAARPMAGPSPESGRDG